MSYSVFHYFGTILDLTYIAEVLEIWFLDVTCCKESSAKFVFVIVSHPEELQLIRQTSEGDRGSKLPELFIFLCWIFLESF